LPPGRKKSAALSIFDQRMLKMLTYLTRKQAWLSPPEIAKDFRLGDKTFSVMTLYRWFEFLKDRAGLVYFPYPRMNLLDLQEVVVRIQGVRNPEVLGIVPYAHSFLAEVSLSDGQPFLTQSYWVPGAALDSFNEYWKTAQDLKLVKDADLFPVMNTHFMFSPFSEVITKDGWAKIETEVDNKHFESMLRRHLHEEYEVRIGEYIATSPLLIPIVLEHLWRHCSSKQVWQAIRAKGEVQILSFGKGKYLKALKKPGAALRILQQQWQGMLDNFEDAFIQPVVFLPPYLIRNSQVFSFTTKTGSLDDAIDMTMRISRNALLTAMMPVVAKDGDCRVWCSAPGERLPSILRIVQEYRTAPEQPVLGITDIEATRQLAQPDFCKFDWRSFEPESLSWRFDGDAYIERLKDCVRERGSPPVRVRDQRTVTEGKGKHGAGHRATK
jgi:hypothetical protein